MATNLTKGQMLDNGVFIFPASEELTAADVQQMISVNQANAQIYEENMRLYVGDHQVLRKAWKQNGPDNRLVANLPHYIVDTYNGFFTGIPVKITLDDDDKANQVLQDWHQANSFQDKLSELSKQTDIYGRSFAFCYQDEDSQTKIAYAAPTTALMIYDDTVAQRPLAFVRYWQTQANGLQAEVYMAGVNYLLSDGKFSDLEGQPTFPVVPAVEFFANEERQGVLDNIRTLANSLDKVLSQKANQVEYFDNAYMKILGVDLDANGDGLPDIDISGNQIIYSSDATSAEGDIDFITKPDGDTMQEHMIDRLVNMIHQIAMVPNLNDEAFSGNSSGVALQYKLLSMRNMAANKERKFTQSLRQLYKVVLSTKSMQISPDAWKDLHFNFVRNLPANLADEAQTASTLSGIVSKQTQLKTLSIVDDPAQELEQIQKEQDDQAQAALRNSVSGPDYLSGDDEAEEENTKPVNGFRREDDDQ